MNRKIFAAGLCLILFVCAVAGGYCIYRGNETGEDGVNERLLGKTPHCFQCTFGEDFVLYKQYTLKKQEKVFSGLYYYRLDGGKDSRNVSRLLSDSFFACANIYRNKVIFINDECMIEQTDMESGSSEILYDNSGNAILDALVIGDCLYFIAAYEDDSCKLLALDLTSHAQKQIAEDINPHYLYHYGKGVAVRSRDNEWVLICDLANGLKKKYSNPEDEILGFLENGDPLLSHDHNQVYRLDGFRSEKKTVLLQKEDIYRVIMHEDEMLICTLGDNGWMEVYIYDFDAGKIDKIANANSEPRDFNKEYVLCCDEGAGLTEMIDRSTGEIENIIEEDTGKEGQINDITEEQSGDEERKETLSGDTGGDEERKETSSGDAGERDYKNAVSEDEYDALLRTMKEYYQNKASWEIKDYRIADNGHAMYQRHSDYSLGNIIIFEVHTTHNPSGPYRSITLGRKTKDDKWKVLNEGI